MNEAQLRRLEPGDVVIRKSNGHTMQVLEVEPTDEVYVWDYDEHQAMLVAGWVLEVPDGRLD